MVYLLARSIDHDDPQLLTNEGTEMVEEQLGIPLAHGARDAHSNDHDRGIFDAGFPFGSEHHV